MNDCLFCRIVRGEIPADIVYQDDETIAFRDIAPQAPVHVLVISREHVQDLIEAAQNPPLLAGVFSTAARVAQGEGVAGTGFRAVVNNGANAQQTVRHLHVHVLGGRTMAWPPG